MLSVTAWSHNGGQGKTSTAQGVAVTLADLGYDVLVVDMDGQRGGLSSFFGLLHGEEVTDVGDDLVDHLAATNDGDIRELIRTREGVDILPSTRRFKEFDRYLSRGPRFVQDSPDEQLRRVIEENELYKEYDVLLVDTKAGTNTIHSRNALFAARNVLVPFQANRKGKLGLDDVVESILHYEEAKRIEIGVAGILPYGVDMNRNAAERTREELETRLEAYEQQADRPIPVPPVVIGDRQALIENAHDAGRSWVTHVNEMDRVSDRYVEMAEKFEELSQWLMHQLSDGEIEPMDVSSSDDEGWIQT
jgi:cellulose biosynthesis protein BcsQ